MYVIKSAGQFFLSSGDHQKGIDQLRWDFWVNEDGGLSRLTFEPSPDVLERGLVGDIVQQECGVCAAIIHRCLIQDACV